MEVDGWMHQYRIDIQTLALREALMPKTLMPPFVPAGTGFQGKNKRYGLDEMIPTSLPHVSAEHSQ